jgi:hypothetical protein
MTARQQAAMTAMERAVSAFWGTGTQQDVINTYLPNMRAAYLANATPEAIPDAVGDAFDRAHVEYWDKNWVASDAPNFQKVRRAANRAGLAAALRAIVEG